MHRGYSALLVAMLLISCLLDAGVGFAQQKIAGSDARIDQYVDKTPAFAERSISRLAEYLGNAGKTDQEKARAIYRWITTNISYDTRGVQLASLDTSAEAVLRSRMTICDGFANLFQRLAEKVGVVSVKIFGASKGDPFAVYRTGGRAHVWNAVNIDVQWHLIDCTWGAGCLDERGKFKRLASDYYFFTPPDEFINGHFPEDPRWQLLDPPLTQVEFEDQLPVSPDFFQLGIKAISHRQRTVRAGASVDITLEAPEDIMVIAALYQGEQAIANSTFVQRSGKEITISVVFPQKGEYGLRIYAKRKKDQGSYLGQMEYQCAAGENARDKGGFPKALGAFPLLGAYLYAPLTGCLHAGDTEQFQLDVPGAVEVIVIVGQDSVTLARDGNRFSGEVTIGKGPVAVAARMAKENRYSVLLEYKGE